ncbi:MAG: hypothetical protein JWL76_139 [Thermoleophilia bacterium]|nr:hypothetical protein [Thermoleophilia bacterium]
MIPPSQRRWRLVALAILALTVAQLAAGGLLDLQQFEGKAFGTRLIAYPLMMLALPVGWWLVARLRSVASQVPWDATALIMWGFLVDVSGNTLDLYDTLVWWDDANHFANWVTLSLGVGLCLARGAGAAPGWLLAVATAGSGAMLAIAWELGEWYTFIRHGTELDTAYEDTLGDEALGTLGAIVAGLVLAHVLRRRRDAVTADRTELSAARRA